MFLASESLCTYSGDVAAPTPLDEIDHQILELLRQDGRRTIADIASQVNLSAAPVKRRIDRLERQGVIHGYTAVLDYGKIGPSIEAFTELRIAGDADADSIVQRIRQAPEVREVLTIAGDPDILIRMRVTDLEHLKQVVNGLRRSGQITGTKTLMVLDRWTRTPSLAAGSTPSGRSE